MIVLRLMAFGRCSRGTSSRYERLSGRQIEGRNGGTQRRERVNRPHLRDTAAGPATPAPSTQSRTRSA